MLKENQKVKAVWVKKMVSQRDWDRFYSQNNVYCYLGEEGVGKGKKIKIGFVVANQVPRDCELLDLDELRQVDNYRKANNIYPRPLYDLLQTF